jgi:AraC-like DNA-binding protein
MKAKSDIHHVPSNSQLLRELLTGMNTQQYIQQFLIEKAKEKLASSQLTSLAPNPRR